MLNDGIELLSEYQQRLAAESAHGVVVVLQALDAAGKDGTIRYVMSGVNPQGVRVEAFKVPSARERGQDYLRRYLTGAPDGGVHATGPTNASRAPLMNLHTLKWDDDLLEAMAIPRALLPEIRSSSEIYGLTVGELSGVPVAGIVGDKAYGPNRRRS